MVDALRVLAVLHRHTGTPAILEMPILAQNPEHTTKGIHPACSGVSRLVLVMND
ncbi:hypothetical protein [Mesorhizobium sp. M0859]|uniref:hypothetical protein n=1 Tax=Mesorhizobium sp. M0859 TaxID=2957014 RepID=UPI00333C0BA1